MTFKKWLSQFANQDNRAGDLYTLVCSCKNYPNKSTSYKTIYSFIAQIPVDENTGRLHAAFDEAWAAYTSSHK
ncbi:MAG: YozE family protein [Oscillospiraceae bacterium]